MNKWVTSLVLVLLIAACGCAGPEDQGAENSVVVQEPAANQGTNNENVQEPPEPEPEVPESAVEEEQTPTPTTAPIQEQVPLEIIRLDPYFAGDGAEMISTGPWMIYLRSSGMVVVSGDGSEIASLEFPLDDRIVSWAVASHGGVFALVKQEIDSLPGEGNKWLTIRSLPTNEEIFRLELMDYSGEPLSFSDEQGERDFYADRHRAVGQVVWSHDGETLAFVGSHNGPSPDVYTYNIKTGEVLQLTSGPAHAVNLAWSPDDAYIFHAGVEKMYTGYSGAGYEGWIFYAARPDGSEVLQTQDGPKDYRQQEIIGWYSDSEVLMVSRQEFCGLYDFIMLDIESGELTTIMKDQHSRSAFDPASKQALVWVSPDSYDSEECGPASEAGLYLVSVPDGKVEKLEGYPPEVDIMEIEWDETGEVFLAEGQKTWLVVDSVGKVLEFSQKPVFSPDWKWVAYVDKDGYYFTMYDVENDIMMEIEHERNILNPTWSPDSSHLFYFQEREKENYFDLYMMEIPGLRSTLIAENVFYRYNQKPIWLMP